MERKGSGPCVSQSYRSIPALHRLAASTAGIPQTPTNPSPTWPGLEWDWAPQWGWPSSSSLSSVPVTDAVSVPSITATTTEEVGSLQPCHGGTIHHLACHGGIPVCNCDCDIYSPPFFCFGLMKILADIIWPNENERVTFEWRVS